MPAPAACVSRAAGNPAGTQTRLNRAASRGWARRGHDDLYPSLMICSRSAIATAHGLHQSSAVGQYRRIADADDQRQCAFRAHQFQWAPSQYRCSASCLRTILPPDDRFRPYLVCRQSIYGLIILTRGSRVRRTVSVHIDPGRQAYAPPGQVQTGIGAAGLFDGNHLTSGAGCRRPKTQAAFGAPHNDTDRGDLKWPARHGAFRLGVT